MAVTTGKKYFNVQIEFDKEIFDKTVTSTIRQGGKGYVCVIESNNLTVANKDESFMQVVNSSLINSCDGSVLAMILGRIHHQPFSSYIGTDIFSKYTRTKGFRHYFLGNTPQILQELKKKLTAINEEIADMTFETLPFRNVDEFDYQEIADKINADNPDMIWVSLGAPKQEIFMNRLEPYLHRGIMVGVGAAFNFMSKTGPVKRAPRWMLRMRLEWLYRAFNEPKKNIPRYWNFIKIMPRLISDEKRKVNQAQLTA